MTSLRELSKELLEVQELASNPDVPAKALHDTLDGMEGLFNDKAVRVVHVIANSDADVEAIDAEIKRLQERKKAIQNAKARLVDYLRFNMEATGITKITSPLFTITLAKGRDVVVIDDLEAVPDELVRTKVTIEPDKKAILDTIKAGGSVPGAHVDKSAPSVRIK